MRGRGGGRGRGAWNRGEDGPQRGPTGPINTEPTLFPPNPNAVPSAPLTLADRRMVALSRLFVGYLQFQDREFLLSEKTATPPDIHTFESSTSSFFRSPAEQKSKIIAHTGPHYFPRELLSNVCTRPVRRVPKQIKRKRTEDDKKADEKEGNDDQKKPEGSEGAEEAPVDDDFGGDDYAHDYYADEDVEDLDDGPEDHDVL